MDRHFGKRHRLLGELLHNQSLVFVSSLAHEFLRFVPVIIRANADVANGTKKPTRLEEPSGPEFIL
jgi:hypothetical protein